MKISNKDKKLLIILVGVLVFIICYFMVYKKFQGMNDSLTSQNAELQSQVTLLQSKVERKDFFESETARMKSEIDDIMLKYPSYLKVENEIMDVVELEKNSNTKIGSLTIGDPASIPVGDTTVSSSQPSTENQDATATEGEQSASNTSQINYCLYKIPTDVSYVTDYNGMKSVLANISNSNEKRSVEAFSAVFDNSTGELSGVITYNTYFVTGTDKNYVEPKIPTMSMGINNIFGTITNPAQESAQ